MDRLTESVRAFYEAYPYPAGNAVDLDGYHVRLLLSYLDRPAPARQPLRVLEAGCGRGLNLQAAAALQPDVDFTGIDINRVAIDEAQQSAVRRGLKNLRFQTGNLLDPASLPVSGEGYDLILSYGVIHHLGDPLAGLRELVERLAPQGVMALMVDGLYGRQPLNRFIEVLSMLEPVAQPAAARMTSARSLASVAEETLFKGNCWQGTAEVEEVEFADRCLHVHEHQYEIDSLWQLLADAGMAFLRWREPLEWSLGLLSEDARLQAKFSRLEALQQYRLIERLCYRPKFSLVIARREDQARTPLDRLSVAQTCFQINPQLKPLSESETPAYRLRLQPPRPADPLEQQLLTQAVSYASGFQGADMAERLGMTGNAADTLYDLLWRLERDEWLYRPHDQPLGATS